MAILFDVLSALLGLSGALLLLVSALRAAPFRKTIDLSEKLDSKSLLVDAAEADAKAANLQLAAVMNLEPRFIVRGASLLILSFIFSILKHLV